MLFKLKPLFKKSVKNTILSVLFLIFTSANVTYASSPSDLIGWWKLDSNITDSSSYFNNATYIGFIENNWVSGKYLYALEFYDDGEYLFANVGDDMNPTAGTFELWVHPINLDVKPQTFISINTSAGIPNDYQIAYGGGGNLNFRVNKEGQEVSVSASSVGFTQDAWHHLVMTWSSEGIKAYVDETLVGTYPGPMTLSNEIVGNLYIGSSFDETEKAIAYIDDVKVWKGALVDTDILAELDDDNDGVANDADYCPSTIIDISAKAWGVHRWYWKGDESFKQVHNKSGKGEGGPFTISDTHGCSCYQILDMLSKEGGTNFEGQYKFGCTTGILNNIIHNFIRTQSVISSF